MSREQADEFSPDKAAAVVGLDIGGIPMVAYFCAFSYRVSFEKGESLENG